MLKVLKFDNKKSLKILEKFLDKRKSIQKNQTGIVSKIINNVKKQGDKAVINYEKKFSRIKTKSNKLVFSNKEINKIIKKTDSKTKKSIDLAFKRIKNFHSRQIFSIRKSGSLRSWRHSKLSQYSLNELHTCDCGWRKKYLPHYSIFKL
jgi:histidinol dehydrogenase